MFFEIVKFTTAPHMVKPKTSTILTQCHYGVIWCTSNFCENTILKMLLLLHLVFSYKQFKSFVVAYDITHKTYFLHLRIKGTFEAVLNPCCFHFSTKFFIAVPRDSPYKCYFLEF